MRSTVSRPRRWLMVAFAGVIGLGAIGASAACGSDEPPPAAVIVDDELEPNGRGPVVNGHLTCTYVDTPAECQDSGLEPIYWHKLLDDKPAVYHENDHSDLLSMLFWWNLAHPGYYYGPGYFNNYISPHHPGFYTNGYQSFQSSHTTVINNYGPSGKYAGDVKRVVNSPEAKEAFKTKSGVKVAANQADPGKFKGNKAANQKAGNGPAVPDPAKKANQPAPPPAVKPAPPAPKPPVQPNQPPTKPVTGKKGK
jgi:hypothetical protein